jgi:hypothetical protein
MSKEDIADIVKSVSKSLQTKAKLVTRIRMLKNKCKQTHNRSA